jgi:hypothetical protein
MAFAPAAFGISNGPFFTSGFTPGTAPAFPSATAPAFPAATVTPPGEKDKSPIIQCLNDSKAIQSAILTEIKLLNERMKHPFVAAATPTIPLRHTHTNVFCNNCMKNNITGCRYKCLFCKDFDLCEDCEARDVHNFHSFIKINDSSVFNTNMMNKIPLFNSHA